MLQHIWKAALLGMMTPVWIACSSEGENTTTASADAILLQGVKADISVETSGNTRATRATTTAREPLYVGREAFVANDAFTMTKFCRTVSTIDDFSYNNQVWIKKTSDSGWTREDDNTKIYWSDAQNGHTFIGFSVPQDKTFDWTEAKGVYSGQLTATGDTIDYTNYTQDGTEVSGNEKMKKDDVVLTYSKEVVPDATGIATVYFRHGLACLTIDLNISGFASTSGMAPDEKDNAARVVSMKILNQPYQYQWSQDGDAVVAVNEEETKTVKAWANHVDGDATTSGRDRRFYYHTLAVPGTRSEINMEFMVTYPDPTNTKRKLWKTYTATAKDVKLVGGKRTVIKISLNHQNEDMTVGAEFVDWIFRETPDDAGLDKNSIYLSSTSDSGIKMHDDASIVTSDDATWLYTDESSLNQDILDIYGNDGSKEHPYSITSANQFLAFAYEVNKGLMDFSDKYVQLDANLYMQASTSGTNVSWIGIGTSDHPFKGHFYGGLRNINRLKGCSLFNYIGEGATVEGVVLVNMLGTTNGGSVAMNNAGTITGCGVNGDVVGTSKAGGICATNSGTISMCFHIGAVKATDETGVVGGIAAENTGSGSIVGNSCYVASGMTGGTVTMQCYYDKEFYPSGTTDEQSSWGKSSSELMKASFVTALNRGCPDGSSYQFNFSPSEYPSLGTKK